MAARLSNVAYHPLRRDKDTVCGQVLSAERPEPYVFEGLPYPALPDRPFGQPPSEADRAALDAYWAEVHHRQAKADAWQAHQRRLAAEAAARALPPARASLGDTLIRALTRRGDGVAPRR